MLTFWRLFFQTIFPKQLQGLKELGELVSSYQGLRDNGARGPSIVSAAIACARRCNLDKDIKDLPEDDINSKDMTMEVRQP